MGGQYTSVAGPSAAVAGGPESAVRRRGGEPARECTLPANRSDDPPVHLLVGRRRLPSASATPLTNGALRSLP